jgi:hypothetical protein
MNYERVMNEILIRFYISTSVIFWIFQYNINRNEKAICIFEFAFWNEKSICIQFQICIHFRICIRFFICIFIIKRGIMYYVYKHTCPNEKVYIGMTGEEPEYRWNGGLGYSKNKRFFKDILYYGWCNIEHSILGIYDTKEDALKEEAIQITRHNSHLRHFGYNTLAQSHAQCTPVAQYTTDGQHIATYQSLNDASTATGINVSSICLCCKGKQGSVNRRTAGSFVWKYIEQEEGEE